MIQFTKWTIVIMVIYLINLLQEYLIPAQSIGLQITFFVINTIIAAFIWAFLYWNIKSDEELGIKPGIELF